MPSRVHTYLFGRLNLIATYNDKQQYLLAGLSPAGNIESHGFEWGFFQVRTLQVAAGPFFHGVLVKYRPRSAEEVAVPSEHLLIDEEARNRVKAKSPFFLHVPSGVIAYRPITGQISPETFRSRFCTLFETAHDGLLVSAEIQSVQERLKLLEALTRFSFIQRISVALHPSNPRNSQRWKRTDERIKALRAVRYREEFEAKPGGPGLLIPPDDEVVDKIVMADDGYGQASATGRIDGHVKTITTSTNPVAAQVPVDDDPTRILRGLQPTLDDILRRTQE